MFPKENHDVVGQDHQAEILALAVVTAADAAVTAMEALRGEELSVESLQDRLASHRDHSPDDVATSAN